MEGDKFFFAWEGADAPGGPWQHLLVLEARGKEVVSAGYDYTIDLVLADGAADVDLEGMLGARATLKILTEVDPAVRLVHGLITEAEEIGVEKGSRVRIKLSPPYAWAKMLKKSSIFVDKTLQQIIDKTLQQTASGMALTQSGGQAEEEGEDDASQYKPWKATYSQRTTDVSRLSDANARPYCVQYEESDVDFLSRIFEEEGIAYHFEHTTSECVLVLSDSDGGFAKVHDRFTLGQDRLYQEARGLRAGGRLRPRGVYLQDYDFRNPDLDLTAGSPSMEEAKGVTAENPGRYQFSKELGEGLARFREERFDTERKYASFESNCRALAVGSIVSLEHPKFGGKYLVHKLDVHLKQRGSFARAEEQDYVARVESLYSCAADSEDYASKFRPARVTPRPRIAGSQTAVITAEPGQEQEINVGGEGDFGSVRLKFHWDWDTARRAEEPSSCWVRVSQTFAGGRGHGAMWHPRVGDEVIVDFLEGDPDRPIVTGRVYNGKNLSPENATNKPTYSCIKSMSSPYNGNYNLIAFDDEQGEEKFIVHVAKDYISNIENNCSRFVMNLDKVEIKGNQETLIHGFQGFELKGDHIVLVHGTQSYTFLSDQTVTVTASQTTSITGAQTYAVAGGRKTSIGSIDVLSVNGSIIRSASAAIVDTAPSITIDGVAIHVNAAAQVFVTAPAVIVQGAAVKIEASGHCSVTAPQVDVTGSGSVNIEGGTVDVTGGVINLNC